VLNETGYEIFAPCPITPAEDVLDLSLVD
jgi:hypothetical protein